MTHAASLNFRDFKVTLVCLFKVTSDFSSDSDWQVPLVIFKREKEVARRLEFDGLYVMEQPPEEDIKGQWDRLVINTPYVHSHVINWADVIVTSNKTMF